MRLEFTTRTKLPYIVAGPGHVHDVAGCNITLRPGGVLEVQPATFQLRERPAGLDNFWNAMRRPT